MTECDFWPGGRTEEERRFQVRLRALQPPRYDVWDPYPEKLVVTVDVVDNDHNTVLRMLRVDFDGSRITGGNDPTKQLSGALDPHDPDWFASDTSTPESCAETAARWFRDQSRRRIERREWDGPDHPWYVWVLADTGRALVHKYLNRPNRPPDRVVLLAPMG